MARKFDPLFGCATASNCGMIYKTSSRVRSPITDGLSELLQTVRLSGRLRLPFAGTLILVGAIVAAAPVAAADVETGRMLYKRFCAHCHGIDRASTGGASSDLRDFPRAEADRFFASVTNGRGLMPALGSVLSPEELEALWLFVATRGGAEPLPNEGAAE
jgi:mono/diheme cytochrome c family protein